jgi:hypothetical protein
MSDYESKYESRNNKNLGEPKERCAVSDTCAGKCRDRYMNAEGMRCPAWYTDDMDKKKHHRR